MFFEIRRGPPEHPNFARQYNYGGWTISTDVGWTVFESGRTTYIAKGYCDTATLHDAATHPDPTGLSGNFAVIKIQGDVLELLHDRNRSFPLWFGRENSLSNMPTDLKQVQQIHSDAVVSMDGSRFQLRYIDPLYSEIPIEETDANSVANTIMAILVEKAEGFKRYNKLPVKAFLTGGLDSMLAYALLEGYAEPINYDFFEHDWFWFKNGGNIRAQHWAYDQLHHWTTPTAIASGATGDEFFFRGPSTVALWCARHEFDMLDRVNSGIDKDSYHWYYFNRPKNRDIFEVYNNSKIEVAKQYPTFEDLNNHILNTVVNDYQHWHLGNTLTWTPFKDARITRALMCLGWSDMCYHAMTGFIEHDLIHELNPRLIGALNAYKNHQEGHNLDKIFH